MTTHLKRLIKKQPRHRIVISAIAVLLLLTLVALRVHAAYTLRQETSAQAITQVQVIEAKFTQSNEEIILPGNVTAWHQATIYARISGYLKSWYADIGTHVAAGELLAVIEAPELDAQLRQAKADLNTAIANNKLAQSTAQRWLNLRKSDSVSKQEADEKVSAAKALQALVTAAQANVDRLNELVGFERITAPFEGVITARNTDIGALINAGSNADGQSLFQIAQTNPLRVYVRIPQNYSTQITAKMKVSLRFAEHPGRSFRAQFIQTAKAIDPVTRTLLAQFKVDNSDQMLFAGSYAEVLFSMPAPNTTIRLPVNTLLFRAEGIQVAVINSEQKVDLKTVTISRDFGAEVEINAGINPGEQIIINPSDSIINGEQVRVVK